MSKKSKGNLIFFPHLFEKHVELAIQARELEDYHRAKDHLEQALLLQEDDETAMMGLMVTYNDLGLYQKARLLAEQMLRQGLGELNDVLRLYIVSLIELEQYEEVFTTLSQIQQDKKLASLLDPEFNDIYRTGELLIDSKGEDLMDEESIMSRVVQDKLDSDSDYIQRLVHELTISDFDRQLQAIEQLKFIESPLSIQALKEFLLRKEADPVLKTFALGALKELGETGSVVVCKWGKLIEATIEQVPDLREGLNEPERLVADLITEKTYHEDPVFSTFALQLWVEFYYATYPLHPKIGKVEGWAAALHFATDQMLGRSTSKKEVADTYHVSLSTLTNCYQSMDSILHLDDRLEDIMKYLPKETE